MIKFILLSYKKYSLRSSYYQGKIMAARSDYRSWGHFDSLHSLVLECVKENIAKVLFQGPANRWPFILQLLRWQLRDKIHI